LQPPDLQWNNTFEPRFASSTTARGVTRIAIFTQEQTTTYK
jgi:hypothetical protein